MRDVISELQLKIDDADISGFFKQLDDYLNRLEIEIKAGYKNQLSELKREYISGKFDHHYPGRLKTFIKDGFVVNKVDHLLSVDSENNNSSGITYKLEEIQDEMPLFSKPDSPSLKIKVSAPHFLHKNNNITKTINDFLIDEVLSCNSLISGETKVSLNSSYALIDNMHKFKQHIYDSSYLSQQKVYDKDSPLKPDWEYELHISILFNNSKILSILAYEWFFSHMGAHPISSRRVYSFDLENGGERITLKNIVHGAKLRGLSRMITQNFYDQLDPTPLYSDEEDIDMQSFYLEDAPVFFLKNNGLYFVFSPYAITAYVFGAQTIYVTFQQIAPYLSEFLPPSLENIFNV
ncbi:RsiV family protein [Microscilla marina]|uniref:DUF3298 domain-containing protein n=1 Tax=Microscilla marina ATCC 23134 TaxID=313606 RepID=A1ZK21_MICM2|nr:RsiV family protein [Microscilla marina]EAY29474.1 hypothetical protein M23134_01534 [Microscilla marina ATCC 23134]